jgi:response regulator NasT
MSNTMNSLRICLAEDDDQLRSVLKRMLTALGHRVICDVDNGELLLEYAGQQECDLALVDLDMPVMDGLAVAEGLQARNLPVILLSGHPDLQHVVTEKEPISASLQKPVTLEQLESAIALAVAHRSG